MPEVSIIILTKNQAGIVEETLENVFAQESSYDFEVIVIDSGSTDGAQKEIKKFPVRLSQIRSEEFNHGKTRNLGASLAQGKYVVFLNGDAKPKNKEWLQMLLVNFSRYEKTAAVYSRVYPRTNCNPVEARSILFDYYLFNGKVKQIESLQYYHGMTAEGKRKFIAFHTISCAIKKDILLLHPFAEVEFGEDLVWAKEILEKGFAIIFENRSEVIHSHNLSMLGIIKRYFDDTRLNQRLLKRWYGFRLFTLPALWIHKTIKDTDYVVNLDKDLLYKTKWLLCLPGMRIAESLGLLLGLFPYWPPGVINALSSVREIKRV